MAINFLDVLQVILLFMISFDLHRLFWYLYKKEK